MARRHSDGDRSALHTTPVLDIVRKLVLFDIDGTLIWSAGAGRSAIAQALLDEMGATGPIDGHRFDGKTDPQIVLELMTAADHPHAASAVHLEAVCRRYLELLQGELDARGDAVRLYPGVADLLAAVEARHDAVLGLLTGNLAEGARMKLSAAGLDPNRFRIGAFGSDAAERAALPAIAADRAAALMGWAPRGHDIVIIGDTPADITCGLPVGARAIGVGTGQHSAAELLAVGAYAAFESLADTAAVMQAIFA